MWCCLDGNFIIIITIYKEPLKTRALTEQSRTVRDNKRSEVKRRQQDQREI